MWETKPLIRRPYRGQKRQRGVGAVEYALVAAVFFTLLFGVIEVARLVFLLNTLQEVTRRAANDAATTDFSNQVKLDGVRQRAIFRSSAGGLVLMPELTDQAIRIDYLTIQRNSDGTLAMAPIPTASLPGSPAENRRNCLVDPNGLACIRLVRVRVCDPSNSGDCQRMQFRSLFSLVNLSVSLPMATTVAKAQSLGLVSGG